MRTDFARRGVPWVRLQLRARRSSSALNLGWRHRLSAAACSTGLGAPALGAQLAPIALICALGTLLALNVSFYTLLARRLGPLQALAGVGLHAVHHLTAVCALAAGLALHAAGAVRRLSGAPAHAVAALRTRT